MSLVCSGADVAASALPAQAPSAELRLYSAALLVTAAAAVLWQVWALGAESPTWIALIPLAAAGVRFRIELPGAAGGASASLAAAADLLALVWLGPAAAMATALASVVSEHLLSRERPPIAVALLNASSLVVTVQIAALTFTFSGGAAAPHATIAAASAYFIVNAVLSGTAVALMRGRKVAAVLRDALSGSALHSFLALGTGAAAAHLLRSGNVAIAAAMLPALYLVFQSYRAHLARIETADAHVREVTALRQRLLASDDAAAAVETTGGGMFEDVMLAHREVQALYEIAQSMGTRLDVSDTMTLVSSKLSSLVPFSSCALFLEVSEGVLGCRFASGVDRELLEQLRVPRGQGVAGWVARHQRPLVNARPSADFAAAGGTQQTALQAALTCPLVFSGRLIGALALYHVTPGSFTDDHRRLLERVCEQAAGVVHNSIVYEQTKREALTDALTGLPNTRFLSTHVARELSRAGRLHSNVSMLVLDLDGFKAINDRHGHHVGDRALREVARVLAEAIRPYDICVRYAGDEFVVVLSDCGPEEAESKRHELQRAVAAVRLDVGAEGPLPLGCSCGSASFPRDGKTYEALLAFADRRMYEDKYARKRKADTPAAVPPAPRRSVFAKIAPEQTTSRPG